MPLTNNLLYKHFLPPVKSPLYRTTPPYFFIHSHLFIYTIIFLYQADKQI